MTDDREPTPDLARKPRPVDDDLRAQVAALHGEGLGRNAIARKLEIGAATVTKIVGEAGLSFDRTQTALALAARQVDLASAREQLARKFVLRADELLESLDDPVVLGNFGGRDNVWNETLLDAPTIDQKRTLIAAAATASRAAAELTRADVASVGTATAVGMLDGLATAFGTAARALEGVDPTETPEQP